GDLLPEERRLTPEERYQPPMRMNNRRRPTLPGPCEPSTIGAEGLNGSVRNGKRCFPLAVATGNLRDPPVGPVLAHRPWAPAIALQGTIASPPLRRALKTTQCQCTDIK